MGCGASRYGSNGVGPPSRLRPLFIQRMEEFALRRRSRVPLKGSSHYSKKVLLLQDSDEEEDGNVPKHRKSTLLPEVRKGGTDKKLEMENEDEVKNEDDLTDGEFEDIEDEDFDQRMLRHDGFASSPSFRVYVRDGEEDSFQDSGDFFEEVGSPKSSVSSGESPVSKKLVKRGKKMKSFKKVLPKGRKIAVKSLLNVRSCYHPSHATHHRAHVLTMKTPASA